MRVWRRRVQRKGFLELCEYLVSETIVKMVDTRNFILQLNLVLNITFLSDINEMFRWFFTKPSSQQYGNLSIESYHNNK